MTWEYHPTMSGEHYIRNENGQAVARIAIRDDKTAAEVGYLMAAAPDLYAVVRMQGVNHDLLNVVRENIDDLPEHLRPFFQRLGNQARAIIDAADAALSRAKGGEDV